MLGALGDFGGLMKQAKDFQTKMQTMQEELKSRHYDGQSGGGMVRVTVNGRSELISIKIDPQAVSDLEMLEDLIKAAVNAAATRSQEALKEEMAKLTGGLNIPGLSNMLGGAGQ